MLGWVVGKPSQWPECVRVCVRVRVCVCVCAYVCVYVGLARTNGVRVVLPQFGETGTQQSTPVHSATTRLRSESGSIVLTPQNKRIHTSMSGDHPVPLRNPPG